MSPTTHTFTAPSGQGHCDVCGFPESNQRVHLGAAVAVQADHPRATGPRPPLPPIDRTQTSVSAGAPATSVWAALKAPGPSGCHRRIVLDHLVHPQGATDDEIEVRSGLAHTTVSARRRGLVLDGWVTELLDADDVVTRPTRTRSKAIVWVLTLAGREQYLATVQAERSEVA